MHFRIGSLPYLGLLYWSSWAHFAYVELETAPGWKGPYDVLEKKMDHETGGIFGAPPNPPEYEDFPDGMTRGTSLKSKIATRVVDACFERVKVEALLIMERKLEEGLEGFKLILNGHSIIEELAKVSMSLQEDK
jgi:hypothetical protein